MFTIDFFRLAPFDDPLLPAPDRYRWVWVEGNALRAGPGPYFGNDDPGGQTLAIRRDDGLWYLTFAPLAGGFTDWSIVPASTTLLAEVT